MKTIKHTMTILLVTIMVTNLNAQNWLWARDGGNTVEASSSLLTVSPTGTIYLFGGFAGTFAIDAVNMSTGLSSGYILSATSNGVFLDGAKITPATGGSPGTEGNFSAQSLNNDNSGSIYLTGQANNSVAFDTIHTNSFYNGYIARFDSALHGLTVKKASSLVYSTAFDKQKNTYVVGDITRSIEHIDTFTLYNSNPQPLFHPKMFLAKLDSTRKCLWVKQSWVGDSQISKVCVKNDNVYFSGYVDSCVIFDTVNHCGLNSFIMRTDIVGNVKWFSTCTYTKHAWFTTIDVDASSNCYVIGGFDSTMYLQNYTLTQAPNSLYNGFIAKYDSVGVIHWIKQFSSDSLFHFDKMHTDTLGNTYALGYFSGTGVFLNDTMVAQTSKDMFITRISNAGAYMGVKILPHHVEAKDITEDAYGNAIVTGNISNGTTYFDNISLTSTGSSNFFLAKLSAITGPNNTNRLLEDNRLTIYPNPNNQNFTIVVPEALVHGSTAHLSIFDNSGRVIKEEDTDISGNRVNTNIGTVQKGMYTVILSHGHKKFTGRVVVE